MLSGLQVCRTSFLAMAGLGLMAHAALAQDPVKMHEVAQASHASGIFTGSVLVARDGAILLDHGYGMANREWNIPNAVDTRFRIGSVTKQFTAAAILLLYERGHVDLDAPIKTYVDEAPVAWDKVTVRHLLQHTSGIPNFTGFSDFASRKTLPTTLEATIARFSDRPLEFQPGSRSAYSNSGYILLSAVIERVGTMPYGDFVRRNLFEPLGMNDTGYDRHATILERRASGYVPLGIGLRNADYTDMSIPSGAGALYASTRDLLKWHQALFDGTVLKPETLRIMTQPGHGDFGMGLIVSRSEGQSLIWHNGAIEGFNAYTAWDPDQKISVIVLGNMNGPGPDTLGRDLVALARGEVITLPHERVAIEMTVDELGEYEGVYQLAPTFAITVRLVDGELTGQATGQSAFALMPAAPDRFFVTAVDARISFTRDEAGQVTGLILHQNGREMPGARRVSGD